ncbi:MAG: ribonuclease VapC [Archaeoglobaceae archaeon]|nr:ribonuclease VapC [Archaeoglobaceae archaeon]MCX8152789.1 ribonuclease VapC [Archaeoglobaceae archaeon]MDW8013496.1 ribonuclease VapC [Archaeoglobaceae archaeon]
MEANRSRNYRVVVLDTNVLIYSFLNKLDLVAKLREEGLKALVPSGVVGELNNLSKGKFKKAALFALSLIEKGFIEVVESNKRSDESLIELAEKFNAYIITNDKNLRTRARKRGIGVGYLREGKILFIE